MQRKLFAAALAAIGLHTPALAHPHVFVDAHMTVVYEDGAPSAVRLTWTYDDYFSLLLTSDLGIDLDGDLILSAQEREVMAKAVTQWPEDYEGDLELTQNAAPVTLAAKRDHTMSYDNGIVSETFTRPIAKLPHPGAPLVLRVYDPYFYISYSLTGPVVIEGRDDCRAEVIPPDLDAAYSMVEELLYGRAASDVGPDEAFPEVGDQFADTVTVTCGG